MSEEKKANQLVKAEAKSKEAQEKIARVAGEVERAGPNAATSRNEVEKAYKRAEITAGTVRSAKQAEAAAKREAAQARDRLKKAIDAIDQKRRTLEIEVKARVSLLENEAEAASERLKKTAEAVRNAREAEAVAEGEEAQAKDRSNKAVEQLNKALK